MRAAIALLPCERPRAVPVAPRLRPREIAVLEAKRKDDEARAEFDGKVAEIRRLHGRQ
jgi:hypothetical protein